MIVHIATALLRRADRVLLVASRYANHAQPLWGLPGGRQRPGELLAETAVRETFEETGLRTQAGPLAYVSESYDGGTHVLNATFRMRAGRNAGGLALGARDPSDHVAAAAWVPIAELHERITVAVVREPLLAYLRGELPERYAGYHHAGITIRWPNGD